MSALDILRRWLSPILDPFGGLPGHLNGMQQNHLSSLNDMEGLMGALVLAPPDEQFAGPAADAAVKFVEDFLAAERTISSTVGTIEEVTTATTTCVAEVETATETLAAAAEGESTLLEITAAVDIVDVAQAGLDPVTDIPGIILTVIAGSLIIGALATFGWAVYQAVQAWIKAMHQASSNSYPNPPKMHAPQNSLTEAQEEMAKRLFKEFEGQGLSLDDIRAIIANNPNLTEAQLRELLSQYGKVIKNHPNLVQKYGALAVFQEFIALAAYDAAHGGNYANRQPVVNMPNLDAGIEEATAEMGAMEEGKVPWPLTPSLVARYDALDPDGTEWDEKSYRSVDTNGNSYDPKKTVDKLQKDFGKGEKIIFDDSQLTQQEIDDTYDELKNRNQEKDVVWWPTEPTQLQSPPTSTP